MKKTLLALAGAACLVALPALGGTPATDKPIVLAEELCIGPTCIGTREEPRYYRDDCREVIIHEQRGDEIIDRRIRQCD